MGRKKSTKWEMERDSIVSMLEDKVSLEAIGKHYGVSKQRMYQVLERLGLETSCRKVKSWVKELDTKERWLVKMLRYKGIKPTKDIINTFSIPKVCPALGIELDYNVSGYRLDNSPSLDRINNEIGYTLDNIHIISMRANRIKNDATIEELQLLTNYLLSLDRNNLQL